MEKLFLRFLFLTTIGWHTLEAQIVPSIEWQKCFGGITTEMANSVQQTSDGGYIAAGVTYSNDGDVSGWHVGYDNYGDPLPDYWIVKLDVAGNLVWQKCLGGSDIDVATSIQPTMDGGFIVAGYSESNDGDVSGNHGGNYGATYDYWIVKLDTDVNVAWQKSLGGSYNDVATSIQQGIDGGYIVAGYVRSNDGDVSGNHGDFDYWIVKLDPVGNLAWQKCLGGGNYEEAYSIQQTSDSGFIVVGTSRSNGGDVSGNNGVYDYWIVKLNFVGNLIWQKSLGGSTGEKAYSVQQTIDNGFIVAGYSASTDSDVSGNHGFHDEWIVKLDSGGNLEWQKSLGGSNYEEAYSIQQTSDDGFLVAGWSESDDGDVSGNHGNGDIWVIKLDTNGNLVWQKCLGGTNGDGASSIRQTIDGGFIVAGYSLSDDVDVSGNHGGSDFWLVKLSSDIPTGTASSSNNSISLFPNPVQNILTINLSSAYATASIAVYDVAGRKIVLPTTVSNNKTQLNTTTLPNGIYMVHVINNSQSSAGKTGVSEVGKLVKEQ
ncbi:MAG TPA: T9SS type A sorting domain-containing protein [Chitinophagales bacterium]|nr:T9SS type A sorting domain-containing protein [Chitinophagales bacterium]